MIKKLIFVILSDIIIKNVEKGGKARSIYYRTVP